MKFIEKFDAVVRSSCPLIWIISSEYDRVIQDIIRYVNKSADFSIFVHDALGLSELQVIGDRTITSGTVTGTADPLNALRTIITNSNEKSFYIFKNFDLLLMDYRRHSFIEYLYSIYNKGVSRNVYFINISNGSVPPELSHYFISIDYQLPNEEEIHGIIDDFIKATDMKTDKSRIMKAVPLLKGLSKAEIENTLSISFAMYDNIDLDLIKKEKANIVKKTGLLEWIEEVPAINDIGGLDNLKNWFTKIAYAFKNWDKAQKYGLKIPKGCLLTGIPGTGKTLSAKAIASLLELPLFRLDIARLYNSLLGETERNLRIALQTIEAVSPCIVLIDEVEKALSGYQSSGQTDSGVTARVFGNLLYYLQEKKSKSFFVCTSNDISSLPPEFLRKGRFDEIWYVGLPNAEERKDIWKIHLKKTGRKPKDELVIKLANHTQGFTGAEIESIINETLYITFYENREPELTDFLRVIKVTTPLSKLESGKITMLEKWAETSHIKRANSNVEISSKRLILN